MTNSRFGSSEAWDRRVSVLCKLNMLPSGQCPVTGLLFYKNEVSIRKFWFSSKAEFKLEPHSGFGSCNFHHWLTNLSQTLQMHGLFTAVCQLIDLESEIRVFKSRLLLKVLTQQCWVQQTCLKERRLYGQFLLPVIHWQRTISRKRRVC